MVMGASVDFMKARVEAGRAYYAVVEPRMGLFKSNFAFRPVRLSEIDGAEFAQWMSSTHFISNSPSGREWFTKHAAEIEAKRANSLPEWLGKPEQERASQTLNAGDGKPTATAAAAPAIATPAPAAPTSPPDPTSSGVEVMFWESVRESKDPADLRAYLEQYPNGQFAPLARNRLAALKQ